MLPSGTVKLKPAISIQANTLANEHHRAILCDFGLALVQDDFPTGLTTSSLTLGTIRYASPELMEGNNRRTLRSDIWAWGCLALEVP